MESVATYERIESVEELPETAARLLDFWQGFRALGPRPTRQDFTPFALKPWIGYLDVYGVEDGGADFRIRLNGTRVTELTGEDWTGRRASDVDERFGSALREEVAAVYTSQQPAYHRTRIFQKNYTTAHRLMLPVFCDSGDGRVVQIFLAIFWSKDA